MKGSEASCTAPVLISSLIEVPPCDIISPTIAVITGILSACLVVIVMQLAGLPLPHSGWDVCWPFVLPGRSGCVCVQPFCLQRAVSFVLYTRLLGYGLRSLSGEPAWPVERWLSFDDDSTDLAWFETSTTSGSLWPEQQELRGEAL